MTLFDVVVAAGILEIVALIAVLAALGRPRRGPVLGIGVWRWRERRRLLERTADATPAATGLPAVPPGSTGPKPPRKRPRHRGEVVRSTETRPGHP